MTQLKQLKATWLADPSFAQDYAALDEEFALARTRIEAARRRTLVRPDPQSSAPASAPNATQLALAILAVDNLRPSTQCVEHMHAVDRGTMTSEMAVATAIAKAKQYAAAD